MLTPLNDKEPLLVTPNNISILFYDRLRFLQVPTRAPHVNSREVGPPS